MGGGRFLVLKIYLIITAIFLIIGFIGAIIVCKQDKELSQDALVVFGIFLCASVFWPVLIVFGIIVLCAMLLYFFVHLFI